MSQRMPRRKALAQALERMQKLHSLEELRRLQELAPEEALRLGEFLRKESADARRRN